MSPPRSRQPAAVKTIKFARGFRVPTHDEIKKALHLTRTNDDVTLFEKLLKHFKPLPEPTDDLDWLAQFRESAQSCQSFANLSPYYGTDKRLGANSFIYYVQIGDDFNETKLDFECLIDYSRRFFKSEAVKLLPGKLKIDYTKGQVSFGDGATSRIVTREHVGARQVKAQSLFRILSKLRPADACSLIGFTEHDLYTDDSDLFVAGLCEPVKRVGVFSCARYDPRCVSYSEEHWYDVDKRPKNKMGDAAILLMRSCRLLVHETCHLLGFEHCVYMDCCMNGSGHIMEDFRQSLFLCPICLKKLSMVFGGELNVREHYKEMKEFFDIVERKNNKSETREWLSQVVLSLESKKEQC